MNNVLWKCTECQERQWSTEDLAGRNCDCGGVFFPFHDPVALLFDESFEFTESYFVASDIAYDSAREQRKI